MPDIAWPKAESRLGMSDEPGGKPAVGCMTDEEAACQADPTQKMSASLESMYASVKKFDETKDGMIQMSERMVTKKAGGGGCTLL